VPKKKENATNILGVLIDPIHMADAVDRIGHWIECNAREYVCVTPIHGIMECYNNPPLRQIFNKSGMTTPDGMGVVWLLKAQGNRHVGRVYGPDLMEHVLLKSLETGWTHFFYGGEPGVAVKLAIALEHKYPGVAIVDTFSPPYRTLTPEEDEKIISRINAANPDILWVGISTPKQELWMAEHVGKLNVPVLIGVGAAFDFLSGTKKQAPKWMQRSGLEWLFRLATEPRRLWRRYLQYPYFALLIVAQLTGIKKYPLL
jgi:N-acetylglucosaminyldiphosphoundecaprenol N-acetyl-beta-D-mannosaminyltransferase